MNVAMASVGIDAARSTRSLRQASSARRNPKLNPTLQFWGRYVEQAVAEAKRTIFGVPTDGALLARWWIEECKPARMQTEEWERSFECACQWLSLNADEMRRRIVKDIEQTWTEARERHFASVVCLRRAMVLACAGVPTEISAQYLMPLVSNSEYEDIAGIDHGGQFDMYDRIEENDAAHGS